MCVCYMASVFVKLTFFTLFHICGSVVDEETAMISERGKIDDQKWGEGVLGAYGIAGTYVWPKTSFEINK